MTTAFPFSAILIVAFATLLFEVSLVRVFSYTIWHHFGYVVISTALLGFGASGTVLAVWPSIGTNDLRGSLARFSILSAIAGAGSLLLVVAVPLHPMSVLTEWRQAGAFLLYQLAATVPFFFSGLLISLALREEAKRVDRLYFFDLIGAGLGCGFAVLAMNWISPPGAVIVSSAAFAVAAAMFSGKRRVRLGATFLCLAFLICAPYAGQLPFTVARTKELAAQKTLLGMEPRFTRWTALFRTDLLEHDTRPWTDRCRHWGISRLADPGCERPRYWISHDATAGTGIYDLRDSPTLPYLDKHILRVPYLVANQNPRVLVIGVGGGRDVIAALQFGASRVVGAELDPEAVALMTGKMDEISGGLFTGDDVQLIATEGRHFARVTDETFDLIQLTGVDTLSAEFSGSYVLAENFLYSVEAVQDYLDALAPGGIVSFATGNPSADAPRAAGRIVSVAREALLRRGIEHPDRHIAVIDSGSLYVSILIRDTPFPLAAIAALESHARDLAFRPLFLPGRPSHAVFEMLATAAGSEREQALDELPFLVDAVTDNRPFFFSFFRWNDLLSEGRLAPTHTSALGQVVLALLLVSLTVFGGIFVLGPLLVFRARGVAGGGRRPIGVLIFFLSIGLGFMLFEISLIQKLILFLGHPTYSLSVTLFSLLIFLGIGSFISKAWVGRESRVLPLAVVGIAALAAFYRLGLPPIIESFLASPVELRIFLTVAMLAPLGLVLGMFFPLGIRVAESVHPDLVPWAWAINGCASVTGGVLAVVLAMSFGFSFVWTLSLFIYAIGVTALLASQPPVAEQNPAATTDSRMARSIGS